MNYREAWANGEIEAGTLVDAIESLTAELAALKAQPSGVVQWPDADEIMQMAFEEGQPSEDASGYYFELEEFDLFIQRLMEEVARLNQPASAGDERETIRAVFLRNGFTIKEGQADLKPYVYAAADELMSIARAALSAPSHGEQVYQFQCREIGEGDWGPCDHSRYMYCQKSPEHDTRVVQVGLQAPSHGEQVRHMAPAWMASARTFVDRLHLAGWRDHADAQHAGVAGMYDELLAATPSAGSQEQGE